MTADFRDRQGGRAGPGPEAKSEGKPGWLARLLSPPATDAERARTVVGTFVLHLRPVRVPEATIRFTHTFGLGGASLVLLSILALTGSLLMLGYTPVPGDAYASIERLQGEVLFGAFVRAVHHWSANLLVLVAGLHMLRVFFTGGLPRGARAELGRRPRPARARSPPRPSRATSFRGTSSPSGRSRSSPGWRPTFRWRGRRSRASCAGGEEIGPATLVNYYALHTQWLPVLLFAGAGFHFWRVRKAGGVVVPPDAVRDEKGKPAQVLFLPHLLWRETAVALVLLAAVSLFSAVVRAPLGPAANPGLSLNPAKAPWYFLGFQELLVHLHPLFAVVVVPLLGAVALVALPYLGFPKDEPRGAWFLSATGRRTARLAAIVGRSWRRRFSSSPTRRSSALAGARRAARRS